MVGGGWVIRADAIRISVCMTVAINECLGQGGPRRQCQELQPPGRSTYQAPSGNAIRLPATTATPTMPVPGRHVVEVPSGAGMARNLAIGDPVADTDDLRYAVVVVIE